MRLDHSDRAELRRSKARHRSRPHSDPPLTKAPDFDHPEPFEIAVGLLQEQMTREVTMTVEELDATREERFGRPDDVVRERFDEFEIGLACQACGAPIHFNAAGFAQHTNEEDGGLCGIPTVLVTEVAR